MLCGHLVARRASTSGRRRTRTSPTGRSPPACARSVSPCTLGWRAKADLPYTQVSDDRSVVAQSGCSSSAPVWWGSVYGSVTRSRSMQRQRLAGLEGLLHHPAPAGGEGGAHRGVEPGGPEHRAATTTSGSARGARRSAPAPRTAASTARCEWSIPFGWLVVPELKITTASSSGVTASRGADASDGARRRRGSRPSSRRRATTTRRRSRPVGGDGRRGRRRSGARAAAPG